MNEPRSGLESMTPSFSCVTEVSREGNDKETNGKESPCTVWSHASRRGTMLSHISGKEEPILQYNM